MNAANGGDGRSIGLIVPCRNEAAVVERRLDNLAQCEWPRGGKHRVVVVDDQSTDGTVELARAVAMRLSAGGDLPFEIDVVESRGAPGKCSAIRVGIERLASAPIEYVGITDSDVVCEPRALTELIAAFERDSRVGMVCAAQLFVRDLASDGSCRGADGGAPVPAGGRYDHVTAAVRRFESRFGRVFSVHGQLLLWRSAAALAPTPGVGADDIDLMFAARRAGWRVELVRGARFLEIKVPRGPHRDGQEKRRARAYFDLLRRGGGLGPHAFDRLQWLCYRHLPGAAPLAIPVALFATVAAAAWGLATGVAPVAALVPIATALVLCVSRPGRDLARLLKVVWRAARDTKSAPTSDRWEMARR